MSWWDEDGFSSCSTCPCHRAAPNHPAGVADRLVSSRTAMLPSPRTRGLGLRNLFLSRPPLGSLALRPGDSLAIPRMAWSVGFIRFVSSTDATQATKVPDFSSGGTVSLNMPALAGRTRSPKLLRRYQGGNSGWLSVSGLAGSRLNVTSVPPTFSGSAKRPVLRCVLTH